MTVDTSSPVPDELDARVEQMLQHMDRVHAEVVNRLDPPTDDGVSGGSAPLASRLDAEVDRALKDAAEAAKAASVPPSPEIPSPPPPPPAVQSNGDGVPSAAIKELDEQLASAVSKAIDDDFADGSELVDGQSLDVPLPESKAPAEIPAAAQAPAIAAPTAPVAEPLAAPIAAPVPTPAPAPVSKPTPAPVPAPAVPATKPAPAPVAVKATPAVIVPVKPAGPTMADRFWTVATPVMEPIAVRLGKLPVGFQHTVGWIGIVTLFMAGATWGYVLFFQETRPASHILEQESKTHGPANQAAGHEAPAHGAANPQAGHGVDKPASEEHKTPASEADHKPEKAKDAPHGGH